MRAIELASSSVTPTIFARLSYRKIRDVYVVLFSPSDLHPHFLRKKLLVASADGISASHVKVKISLMTGPASIKLWSLTSQFCLHTFTHHTDSVWALYSSHPSLEIFYSGDESGFVAKIDVEGCAQISDGECALVFQDVPPPAEGVTKLIAFDDTLVWTASGSSSLRRWRAPSRRAVRANTPIVEPLASAASHTSSSLRLSRSTDLRPRSITLDFPPSPPSHRQFRGIQAP